MKQQEVVNMLVNAPVQAPLEERKSKRRGKRIKRLDVIEQEHDLGMEPSAKAERTPQPNTEFGWIVRRQDREIRIEALQGRAKDAPLSAANSDREGPDAQPHTGPLEQPGKLGGGKLACNHGATGAIRPSSSSSFTRSLSCLSSGCAFPAALSSSSMSPIKLAKLAGCASKYCRTFAASP